jgi:geranylgeranyl pyrophosphate synthase
MIEEYEILTEEDNLQVYFEGVKPLIDKTLRENLPTNVEAVITFPHKPIFASFMLLSAEVCGGKFENVLNTAVSVEFIKKSSQHFEHDTATAISLLNAAYGAIFESKNLTAERQILAHKELVDCLSENKLSDLKNSNLIRLAMRIGAVLSGADYIQLTAITRFADLLEKELDDKNDNVFFNPNNFVGQAKRILQDEFGNTSKSHLLCDLADFIAKEKV